jgi:demethylmenaquinone methyltransferase/2-methoxy-6-polyprenyl-1,4-benzoquinol methylase
LFKYYFRKILPFIGGIFSSKEAYTYLPESVEKFPRVNDFSNEIKSAGFGDIKITSLSFGMVKLYEAKKI